MECAAISSLQRQIAESALALVLAWLCASARAQSPDPTKAGRPMQGVNASATYDCFDSRCRSRADTSQSPGTLHGAGALQKCNSPVRFLPGAES